MRFEMEVSDLRAAATMAASVTEGRNVVPILACLLVIAKDGAVSFTGSNLDQMASARRAAAVSDSGRVCLHAATVIAAAKAAPSGAVIRVETVDRDRVTMRAGRWSATIPSLPAEDFPTWNDEGAPHEVPGAKAAMPHCAPFMSSEETRYYLNGVYIGGGHAVATDGGFLGVAPCETADGAPDVIVPRPAVPGVIKLLDAGGRLFVGTTQWRCETEGEVLRGKMVDGAFPDWTRIVPRDGSVAAVVAASDLADAVEAATMGQLGAVRLRFEDGRIVAAAERIGTNADRGMAEAGVCEVDAADCADGVELGFQARVLLPALRIFADRTVTLRGGDPGAPIVIDGGDGLRTVVMPYRLRVAAAA